MAKKKKSKSVKKDEVIDAVEAPSEEIEQTEEEVETEGEKLDEKETEEASEAQDEAESQDEAEEKAEGEPNTPPKSEPRERIKSNKTKHTGKSVVGEDKSSTEISASQLVSGSDPKTVKDAINAAAEVAAKLAAYPGKSAKQHGTDIANIIRSILTGKK